MADFKRCRECGVPSRIAKDYEWTSGGAIAAKRDPEERIIIYETEAINCVLSGIEELIGVPIERLVVESRRRFQREYQEAIFPAWMRKCMNFFVENIERDSFVGKTIGRPITAVGKMLTVKVNNMGRVTGLGDITLGSMWESLEKYPHRENIIRNPYSLLLYLGDNLGATEAWEMRDMQNRYEELGEDTYLVRTFEAEHPVELKGRLRTRRYTIKPGDIAYRRCPACGVPVDISRFEWDYDEGTITDPRIGKRIVFTDPVSLQAVFQDLEAELGEDIPRAIVESQSRYVKTSAATPGRMEESQLKEMLALWGLGDLRRFEMEEGSLQMKLENAVLHLLMVGILQAMFELSKGIEDCRCEWELGNNGDLTISLAT